MMSWEGEGREEGKVSSTHGQGKVSPIQFLGGATFVIALVSFAYSEEPKCP